jgi:hypothetical protein
VNSVACNVNDPIARWLDSLRRFSYAL